jgi:hypothetical protein
VFWLLLLGVVGAVWVFAIGVLALADSDISLKTTKSITPVDAAARAQDRGAFPPP